MTCKHESFTFHISRKSLSVRVPYISQGFMFLNKYLSNRKTDLKNRKYNVITSSLKIRTHFYLSCQKRQYCHEKWCWHYQEMLFKGATKSYFMPSSWIVISLFNADLCRSTFSTYYFKKVFFSSSCVLCFCHFCFELDFVFEDLLHNIV